jgi:hypothetical protein
MQRNDETVPSNLYTKIMKKIANPKSAERSGFDSLVERARSSQIKAECFPRKRLLERDSQQRPSKNGRPINWTNNDTRRVDRNALNA